MQIQYKYTKNLNSGSVGYSEKKLLEKRSQNTVVFCVFVFS